MAGDAALSRLPPGSVFVGREWELTQLRAALSVTQSGRGQLFVVSGEAGIGKTRLVGKLADLAENEQARVLWGRCWEGQEAPAFWPWIQIFRNMIRNPDSYPGGIVGQSLPDLAQLIPELGGSLAPEGEALHYPPSDQARFRLFDAATMSIRTAAESRPLVLIMEDLHEADRSSLLLLEFLARQLSDIPLLVLATSREPEAYLHTAVRDTIGTIAGSGHMMSLVGLRRDEINEFLGQGFDILLTEESLSAVQEGTGGNPLFLDELARRFVAEQRLREVPGGGLEVPEGLKAPIRSRLASLSADAQALVALASVVGREFSFELLVAASGLTRDTVRTTLGRLSAARFVDPADFGLGPYRFAHALVRETIYQDLPAQQRWQLHRRIGQAIETLHQVDSAGYLDHLAHHFSEAAALGELDRAIEYSRQAGKRAARQLGYDEAIRHYRRALELAQADQPAAPKPFDLLLALGDAQWWAGQVCQASETFQAAAALARELKDPHRLAEAALRVGEVGYGGAYVQAWAFDPVRVALLDEALDAIGEQESLLKVRVLARLSTTLYFSPFDSASRRDSLARASVELARRLGDGSTLAYALNARHLAVWGPDNVEERLILSAEIVELAHQAGDVSMELIGHVWCLADQLETGDVPGADREIEAYEALARRVGYPHFIAYAFMFRAMQAMLRGEFADAETFAGRSLALGEQVGDGNVRFSHQVQMAVLRALQGRAQECAAYCEPAAHEQPQFVRLMGLAFCCLAGDRGGVTEAFPLMWRARDRIPPALWLSIA
ncbi:MAG: ATP-binding protein, partial [Pseudonocardiaceae bacterium]